ncbi:MAG: class I SAM-dependent methyltransferase [Nitriliruptoraceae bacterium]
MDRRGVSDRTALVEADAVQLPLAQRCFDAVYLSFTLELFDTDELATVLDECRRVLRPTGRLAVVSPALTDDPPVMTRPYLRARGRLPSLLDCRPIPTDELVLHAGFAILARQRPSVWGLFVDVVVATPLGTSR